MQVLIGLWVALSSSHNHFVWYSGGDATEYWTASWSLAHGEIGQSLVGYGIPVLYAWVPLVTGTTLLGGLPVIAVLQFALLVPLSVVCFWGVADRLFGRLFAWWATALFVAAPLLMYWGFSPRYAPEFRTLFLAGSWYGLTNMADMPSLVATLATAWAALRLLERRTVPDGILAGLLTGVLVGLKPANGFFLPALAVLLVAVRRPRPLLAWGAAFAPALLTLALWKARGLGNLPIASSSYAPAREAGGLHPVLALSTSRYLQFDWTHFQGELADLKEIFWSVAFLEFLAIAGVVAAIRRAPLKGSFVALWFVGFCIVKGSSDRAGIMPVSYWRFVEPGLPALVLLVASLVYLVPRRGRPFAQPAAAAVLAGGRRALAAAALVLAGIPLVLMVAASPASSAHYVRANDLANDAPLSSELSASAQVSGAEVRLTWHPLDTSPTGSYYVVYRSSVDDGCSLPEHGAKVCVLQMDSIGTTRSPSFLDRPGKGPHWYRIALMANYRDALDGSDLMLVGPATEAASSR